LLDGGIQLPCPSLLPVRGKVLCNTTHIG
jgi:hypothetical protein